MTQSGRVTWAWEEGRRERLGKKGPMRRGRKGLGIFSLFYNSKNIIWLHLKIWTRSFQVRNFLSDLDTTDCYTVPFEKNTKLWTTKSRNLMNNENTKRCRLPSTLEPPPHLTSQGTRLSTSTADDLQRRFILWPYKINTFDRKDVLPVILYLPCFQIFLLVTCGSGSQTLTMVHKCKLFEKKQTFFSHWKATVMQTSGW